MNTPKAIALVGPTASGKTSLSIALAQTYSGEVISADSRQVYRDLDIGTAKVTAEEMQDVPHHLIDIVDVDEVYTGTQFLRDANSAMDGIYNRGNLPIIAGGTNFYVNLLRGTMSAAPVEPDQAYRESLEPYSNQELLDLLESKDPRRAVTIDPHNRRRLVRALEIINTLGTVPDQTTQESPYDWLVLGIESDKETLQEAFRLRLADWLEAGLLAETESLQARVSAERFKEFGFEYTLAAEYFHDRISLEEYTNKFVEQNWQYAKRQLTWLKKDGQVVWVDPHDTEGAMSLVRTFIAA